MKKSSVRTRIVFVVLAALLALPLAPTAAPVEAKQRARTVTKTFSNAAGMYFNNSELSPVSANLYPSPVAVRGLKGKIRDVNVQLTNFFTGNPDDFEVLLVGPRGQTAVVMANVGGSTDVIDVTLRLDDEAETPLPDSATLQSGAFRPTNATNSAITFNAPAPSAGANAALSVFDGGNPNGTWHLFAQDENGPIAPGGFGRGWALEIETRFKAKREKR